MTYDIPLVHISMHVDRLRLNVHVYYVSGSTNTKSRSTFYNFVISDSVIIIICM